MASLLRKPNALLLKTRWAESSLPGQGLRFVSSGAAVALFYLLVTITLANGFGITFQVALAVGFVSALALHFLLQRAFVWAHHSEFALTLPQQVPRYLALAGLQYGATVTATRYLPDVLGVSVTVVYVVSVVTLAAVNFLIFRSRVFHPRSELAPRWKATRGT